MAVKPRQGATATTLIVHSPPPGSTSVASAPMPTRANVDLSVMESQLASPANVPANGPMLRSTKK